ncbi:MAG: hypothetical protein H0X26_10350 [Alphaproteobacteria bacterium]|nr:hypothetical protein [Alphaproteobacteria bacterium]
MRTASMAFMERPDFFDDPNAKEKFLELVIESLFLAFSSINVAKNRSASRIYA